MPGVDALGLARRRIDRDATIVTNECAGSHSQRCLFTRSISSGSAAPRVGRGAHHRVHARRDQRGLQALAAHVGDREEHAPVGHRHDVDVVAADPLAGLEADRHVEPGKSSFFGHEAALDLARRLQLALDRGVRLRVPPRRPRRLALLVDLGRERDQAQPLDAAESGGSVT